MKTFNFLLSAILSFAVLSVCASDLTIKNGVGDWTKAANYEEGKAPVAGDNVIIQTGVSVSLTNDASIEVAKNLSAILFKGVAPGGTLMFKTDSELLFTVKMNGWISGSEAIGKLIKQGSGELQFASEAVVSANDYRLGELQLESGSVRYQMSAARGEFYLPETISITNGANLYLPKFTTDGDAECKIVAGVLNGNGDVYYEATEPAAKLLIKKDGEFSGRFFANALDLRVEGDWKILSSSMQVKSLTVANDGSASLLKIADGSQSSVGLGNLMTDGTSGKFAYVGADADSTSRQFLMSTNSPTKPSVFDAGAFGGITFTGIWSLMGVAADMSNWCVIDGSNTTACTLRCEMPSWRVNGHDYTTYMEKRGTGTWCFDIGANSTYRQWAGGLAVREGKVQFTSIAPAGSDSALGSAAILTTPYLTAYDETKNVDYAIVLGSAEGSGATLEYAPTSKANGIGTGRKIRLEGDAAIGTTGAPIAFADVTAVGDDEITLKVYGDEATNRLYGINEASAKINLVKEGNGALMIGDQLDISGAVEVNAGTLIVDNPSSRSYRWYRFTAKQNYDPANATVSACMQELALYDGDGKRQNVGMEFIVPSGYRDDDEGVAYDEYVTFPGDRFALKPNSATYDQPGIFRNLYDKNADNKTFGHCDLRALFDDKAAKTSPMAQLLFKNRWGREAQAFTNGVAETWLRIVMRVAEDCPELVAYDYCRGNGNKTTEKPFHPVYFSMEGSVDGVVWETIHEATPADDHSNDKSSSTTSLFRWMSDGTAFKNSSTSRKSTGYFFTKTARTISSTPLIGVKSYKLGANAKLLVEGEKLTISELRIDKAGNNTIKNVKFADNGVLDVISDSEITQLGIKIEFDGVEGSDMKDWVVKVNGTAIANLKAVRSDSGISVLSGGGFVIIR